MAEIRTHLEAGKLHGRCILITGAGGDIGRAAALFFTREGARSVLVDREPTALEETRRLCTELGLGEAMALQCDVTDEAAVVSMVEKAADHFGRIDGLFNNAGIQGEFAPLLEHSTEAFKQTMEVNVLGAFIVLKAVGRHMRDKGGGAVVNTASMAAARGTPAMCAYVASKAALVGLTKTACKDLAPFQIRVNCISPALIGPGVLWDRQNELHAASGSPFFATDPATVADNKINSVPMRRLGTLEEVASVATFLLSSASSYVTGNNVEVSGGLS
jgi:NAD(P)-dependent dehydrogenase (short-subunit alcohol dehydrogenase family)